MMIFFCFIVTKFEFQMSVYFAYLDVAKGLMVSPFVYGEVFDVKHVQSWYPHGDDVCQWILIGGKSYP